MNYGLSKVLKKKEHQLQDESIHRQPPVAKIILNVDCQKYHKTLKQK